MTTRCDIMAEEVKTKTVPSDTFTIASDGKTKLFKKGHSVGRPKGSKNKTRLYAEALMGYNGNKIVREIIRKALDPDDKDQAMMLKVCLERILPPVREVNINSTKQMAVQVLVEGVESFTREGGSEDVIEGELVGEDLDVPSAVPEEVYSDIDNEEVEDELDGIQQD